jgi:hypothetical protein
LTHEAGEVAGGEYIKKLERWDDAIGEDVLVCPGLALSHWEAQEDGFITRALGDNGEGVPKILKEVFAR